MSSIFLEIIERELKDTSYIRTDSTSFDNIRIITLFWGKSSLILKILLDENECCLTGKNINYIFTFYIDDVEEVAIDVVKMIKNHGT